MEVFKCPKCLVYFSSYSLAFKHLKVKHKLQVKSVETVHFSEPNLCLERVVKKEDKKKVPVKVKVPDDPDDKKKATRKRKKRDDPSPSPAPPPPAKIPKKTPERKKINDPSPSPSSPAPPPPPPAKKVKKTRGRKKGVPWKSRATVAKTKEGGVEIKLDSLKASEIEALMQNFFDNNHHQSTKKGSGDDVEIIRDDHHQNTKEQVKGKTGPLSKRAAALAAQQVFARVQEEEGEEDEGDDVDDVDLEPRVRVNKKKDVEENEYRPTYAYQDPSRKNRRGRGRPPLAGRLLKPPSQRGRGRPRGSLGRRLSRPSPHSPLRRKFDLSSKDPYECGFCQVQADIEESGKYFTFDSFPPYQEHMEALHLKDGVYTCPSLGCGKTFALLEDLDGHIKRKKKKRGFRCGRPTCNRRFLFESQLIEHEKWHENRVKRDLDPARKLSCPLCGLKFIKKTSLQSHFVIHLENNPFICKMDGCDSKFGCFEHLQRHLCLHIGKFDFKCTKCGIAFARLDSLNKHVKYMHESGIDRDNWKTKPRKRFFYVKRVPVPEVQTGPGEAEKNGQGQDGSNDSASVEAPSTTTSSIRDPLDDSQVQITQNSEPEVPLSMLTPLKKEKQEDEMLRVEVGSEHFDDDTNLEDVEEDNENSESTNSKEQNRGEEALSDHPIFKEYPKNVHLRTLITSDPVYKKLLQDNPEGAELIVPTTGRHHPGYVLGNQTFRCPECPWYGKRAFSLNLHLKKHHGKDLNSKLNESTKEGDKPNENGNEIRLLCGKCGYHSTSPAHLAQHMESEHPVKDAKMFPCELCKLRFRTIEKLNKHKTSIHFAEKKFACPHCPAKYRLEASLKKHVGFKHDPTNQDGTLYQCKLCNKNLSNLYTLRNHEKAHTRTDLERVACKYCHQTLASRHVLKRHVEYVHMGVENPYNRKRLEKIREDRERKEKGGTIDETTAASTPPPPEENGKTAVTEDDPESILGL